MSAAAGAGVPPGGLSCQTRERQICAHVCCSSRLCSASGRARPGYDQGAGRRAAAPLPGLDRASRGLELVLEPGPWPPRVWQGC